KVEPVMDRFDRVLLRVDVAMHREDGKRNSDGRNEVTLTAFADGIGEVARATLDLNRARRGGDAALDTSAEGVLIAPAFGSRRPADGFVPEFYLASLRVQQINEGEVSVVRGDAPLPQLKAVSPPPSPKPAVIQAAVPSRPSGPPRPSTPAGPPDLRPFRG